MILRCVPLLLSDFVSGRVLPALNIGAGIIVRDTVCQHLCNYATASPCASPAAAASAGDGVLGGSA